MFDIPTRDPVDIIWINSLNPDHLPDTSGSCLDTKDPPSSDFCTLMAKINKTQTFLDPTRNDMNSKKAFKRFKIGKDSWPMSTHIHGAEIRPTFDGNPLSWIDNGDVQTGIFGIAAFSDEQTCYYDSFDRQSEELHFDPPKIKIDSEIEDITNNYKINRYPNQQNPGTLWYHDHAMHLTTYNVRSGLSGYYVLRDDRVEQ